MTHVLEPLARLDGVAAAVAEARTACTDLRWHRALRRQWAVARVEAGVRSAWAGSALDGVRRPLDHVRDMARGALPAPDGVEGEVLLGALRIQAEVERAMAPPGSAVRRRTVPLAQLLARLHSLAALGPEEERGRLRDGAPSDLGGLGAAVGPTELRSRLTALARLVDEPLPAEVPALVLASIAYGEVLVLRPFGCANGAVARGVLRHLVTSLGVDPVGVVVPEVAWTTNPHAHLSAVAHYATGTPDGVAGWLVHCAQAVAGGAAEATAVAEAVLAGTGLVRPG